MIPTLRTRAIWTWSRLWTSIFLKVRPHWWWVVKASNCLFIASICCINSATIIFKSLFTWTVVVGAMVICTVGCYIIWSVTSAILPRVAFLSTVARIGCMICGILCRNIWITMLSCVSLTKEHICRYNWVGSDGGVMVIVVGNGHDDTSSNLGREWLHFT